MPSSRCRPEVEAVSLARDVARHHDLSRAFPFLVHDGTSLLGSSTITLADAADEQRVVVAVKAVPQRTQGTAAARQKLEEARLQVLLRAAEEERRAPGKQIAAAVVSNVAGLQWVTKPLGMQQRRRQASSVMRVLRWAAAAATFAAMVAAALGRLAV